MNASHAKLVDSVTPITAIAVARPRAQKRQTGFGAYHTYPGHAGQSPNHLPQLNPWPVRQQGHQRDHSMRVQAGQCFKWALLAIFCCYSLTSLTLNAMSIGRLMEKIAPVNAIHTATQAESLQMETHLKRYRQAYGREALLRNTLDYTEPGDLLIRFRPVR